jgi:hypothetical protein
MLLPNVLALIYFNQNGCAAMPSKPMRIVTGIEPRFTESRAHRKATMRAHPLHCPAGLRGPASSSTRLPHAHPSHRKRRGLT